MLALAACGAGGAVAPAAQAGGPAVIAITSQLIDGADDLPAPKVGEPAPDFAYTFSDGTTQRLSDLRGKKTLLNFWATWCAPCLAEMPDLQRVADVYGDAITILGINKLEQPDVIPPFAAELGISFPLIANPKGDISRRYGANNIPITYFINTDGTIGHRKVGIMTYDFIKQQVDELR